MKSYIDDLFKYIETYEKDYARFETEAFIQTYTGIVTVFQTLRTDRNQAVEADYYFLDKIKLAPLTSSDLRQLTVQILIARFESEADTDGRSEAAYSYCRGLRAVKQDVPFIEGSLVKLLFDEGSLNGNWRLSAFFLNEMAYYVNRFGKNVKADLNPEEFDGLSDPLKMLELQRRRLSLGNDVIKDRTSLEFHLQRVGSFGRLGAKSKVFEQCLREWNYLAASSFWAKLAAWLGELGTKFKGAFSSFGYFRLLSTQRKPAYLAYTLLIILSVAIAYGVPSYWNKYADKQLEKFQHRVSSLQGGAGK
jgi:hypothetical protein